MALICACSGCGYSRSASGEQALAKPKYAAAAAVARPAHQPAAVPATQLDGRKFPDHVLAMTWDDGPDQHTVELAQYLRSRRVSGTFFVVRSWQEGLSDAPGSGPSAFETGYAHLPILKDLVRLGQRLANHTLNHVRLPSAEPGLARLELAENQRQIDPFLNDEARFFRAPAGAWNADVAGLTSSDAYLRQLIGPIRWDIDRKDWESSIECKSNAPTRECEPWHDGLRLKPQVTARHYLDTIEHVGRGIVLLHDRVGDVGSRYALDVARSLLPELSARGYVFAAPVLEFSKSVGRVSPAVQDALASLALANIQLVDADGDGRADLCGISAARQYCLRSEESPAQPGDGTAKVFFGAPAETAEPGPAPSSAFARKLAGDWDDALARAKLGIARGAVAKADVTGDGHADACWASAGGILCALWRNGAFAKPSRWFDGAAGPALFGDLNGDRRDDICFNAPQGIACAFSTGASFTTATTWLATAAADETSQLTLGDINGDGRADVCRVSGGQVACGLAP